MTNPFLAIFFGWFLGVASTLLFDIWRRHRDKYDQQFEAILLTEVALLLQRNSLLSIMQKVPAGKNPFTNLKYAILNFSSQSIDFSKLAFLGKESDPGLILALDVAQELYRNATRTAELRNKLLDEYLNHPDTKVESLDDSGDQVRATGDPRLAKYVRQANDLVWESIQRAERQSHETFNRLYKFAVKKFPKEKKMPFAIPKPPPTAQQANG